MQKARWSSSHHATTIRLVWTDGDGFAIEDKPEIDDEQVAGQIIAFVGENPGTGWTRVENATRGVTDTVRRRIRDGLLSDGVLVNVRRSTAARCSFARSPSARPRGYIWPTTRPSAICGWSPPQTRRRLRRPARRGPISVCGVRRAL